ncbi:acyltransferase family protein [Bifidobacterium primatium]|uniref:acyltransferase family protein n=1 Tax=Bifidobacterium primatium TaxID=2045438 RepID=UPI001FAEFE80|nr:acyltransferase family protein [Bifidobacterium primatium]
MSEIREKSGSPARHTHFAGIDGLRALAIIGVIAFHTRPSLLQGGFIGVTLFFVITGFLATRSVLGVVDADGTFGYGRYLVRRVKRLLPPTLAIIAVTPALVWLFAPSLLQKVVSDALPGALFASNWVYIFRKVPYFQAAGLPSPLTHLWFLGVTMQFYILWPLLLMVLGRLTKSKWIRSIVVVVIMIASSAAMFLLFDPASTSRVYYGTDTRFAELAAGALLAIWMAPKTAGKPAIPAVGPISMPARTVDGLPSVPLPAGASTMPVPSAIAPASASDTASASASRRGVAVILADVFGAVALVALLAGFWFANGYLSYMYRGGYAVAAVVSLIALSCTVQERAIWPKVLGCAPLRYIGSRSFSLYLVHYPLLQIMNPATRTEALPWWGWLVQFAIIIAAGEVFYQLVEAARKHTAKPVVAAEPKTSGPASSESIDLDKAPAPVGRPIPGLPVPDVSPLPVESPATAVVTPAVASAPRRSPFGFLRSSGLRPGAWVMSALGVIVVIALTWAPVNWAQIAQSRAVQLRPELAEQTTGRPLKPKPKPKPKKTASASASAAASAKPTPTVTSKAEKVPNNFDISKYHYDPATQSCSADIMMVGDSVTSGTSEFIQETFPNGFIDGKPNRQMPEAVGIYQADVAAGHNGSVVIFGLGTNGIIENEQEVQKLIDATGGKPTFFVTIRMPYPWQETNNNTMLRQAAAKNPNVGIIDWHGYSEGHSEYFGDDGIHPGMTGAAAYATMLRQAVCGQ